MEKERLLSLFNVNDLRLLPEAILPVVLSNGPQRDDIYRKLLEMNHYDVSHDWFQEIYEAEQSERKEKKQDFTPAIVSQLASMLCGQKDGSTYEPTAGNGGMIIADWWRKALAHVPFDFFPSENPVECWEISGRSLPFLLLNLSIRGIVGIVHHGDVLEGKESATYKLVNEKNDCLAFSKIYEI